METGSNAGSVEKAESVEQPESEPRVVLAEHAGDVAVERWEGNSDGWQDETPFRDSFMSYVFCLLLLALGGMLVFVPILMIPIGDCVTGLFGERPENLPPPTGLRPGLGPPEALVPRPSVAYYFGYGPIIAFLLLTMGLSRFQLLCRRVQGLEADEAERGLGATGPTEARRGPLVMKWQHRACLWYPWALLTSEVAFLPYTLAYLLVSPAWTPWSYCFLWATGLTAGICSAATFLSYSPPEARGLLTLLEFSKVDIPNTIFLGATMCPMLLAMLLSTFDFIPTWVGDILVPLCILALDFASERLLPPICEAVVLQNGWSSSYLDSGYDFQRRLLIEFGTTMILSTGCSYVEVAAVVFFSACLLQLDYKRLRLALQEGGQPAPSTAQEWSYARMLCMQVPEESYREQRRLWRTHDPQKFTLACSWCRERANAHFAAMAAPLYYTAAVCVIHWLGPNKYDYYMFECYDDEHVLLTIRFSAYGFLWSFLTMCLDLAAAHRMDIGAVVVYECNAQLYRAYWSYLVTATFIGAVFTSCLFIKHDGVAVLQDFAAGVANC